MRFNFAWGTELYLVHVTHYSKPCPMRITGTGFGDAEPPEDEEFEFYLKDSSGEIRDDLITPTLEAAVLERFKYLSK